jgi:vitamin B12/bleomycin/antimicrobial peptide transport system ATP-binding/permease protein
MLPKLAAIREAGTFLRRVRALVVPYWQSEERWAARGLLAAVVFLTLGLVVVLVLLNDWNREFYNALEQRDFEAFQGLLLRFGVLAGLYIAGAVYRLYLRQMLEIRWRGWLTRHYLDLWLGQRAYYHLELRRRSADNPDQRIAEDLRLFTTNTLSLSLDFLSSAVTLCSFIVVVWTISGPLDVAVGPLQVMIPGYMVWAAALYALGGSWLTHRVGRRLIGLNFRQQRVEADFRFSLARLREHAESVALYGGEASERGRLLDGFGGIRGNWVALTAATKRLTFLTVGYAQLAVIFPFIVASPRYFAGIITLGTLMQISTAFGQVQTALSWFVNSYSDLASWKATADRLLSFHGATAEAVSEASGPTSVAVERGAAPVLRAEGLALRRPDGPPLLAPVAFSVQPGEHVVIVGPSGSGKSTLLRALAGIWPYGHGRIQVPAAARVMFLPQKPYVPIASLRDAVSYPAPAGTFADAQIREALQAAGLLGWDDRLDEAQNWSLLLSGGEQQRLAFARALLHRPDWLFLDEATSALDVASGRALLEAIQRRLPTTTVVSVTHHPEQVAASSRRLVLTPGGEQSTLAVVESLLATPPPALVRPGPASVALTTHPAAVAPRNGTAA